MKTIFSITFFTLLFTCSNPIQSQELDNANESEESTAALKERIDSLIDRIDVDADILHSDYTQSVFELSELGIPAMEAVLPLLNSDNSDTRLHAQRVLEGVVSRMYGYIPGLGSSHNPEGEETARNIIESMGYDWQDATLEHREEAIANWKNWIDETKSSKP